MRAHASSNPVLRGAAHAPVSTVPRDRLSAAALKLHVFAVLVSIYEQHPGVVRQAYLDGIHDDVTAALLELCAAGLWTPGPDRYLVPEPEVLRIAQIVHDQVRRPPSA